MIQNEWHPAPRPLLRIASVFIVLVTALCVGSCVEDPVSVRGPLYTLMTPSLSGVGLSNTSIRLTWRHVPGANYYALEFTTSPGNWPSGSGVVRWLEWSDPASEFQSRDFTSLNANQVYYCRIRAYYYIRSGQEQYPPHSAWSAVIQVPTIDQLPPDPIDVVGVTDVDGKVLQIRWSLPSDTAEVEVRYGDFFNWDAMLKLPAIIPDPKSIRFEWLLRQEDLLYDTPLISIRHIAARVLDEQGNASEPVEIYTTARNVYRDPTELEFVTGDFCTSYLSQAKESQLGGRSRETLRLYQKGQCVNPRRILNLGSNEVSLECSSAVPSDIVLIHRYQSEPVFAYPYFDPSYSSYLVQVRLLLPSDQQPGGECRFEQVDVLGDSDDLTQLIPSLGVIAFRLPNADQNLIDIARYDLQTGEYLGETNLDLSDLAERLDMSGLAGPVEYLYLHYSTVSVVASMNPQGINGGYVYGLAKLDGEWTGGYHLDVQVKGVGWGGRGLPVLLGRRSVGDLRRVGLWSPLSLPLSFLRPEAGFYFYPTEFLAYHDPMWSFGFAISNIDSYDPPVGFLLIDEDRSTKRLVRFW